MHKKLLFWSAFGLVLALFVLVQFAPSPPVVVPATLPPAERAAARVLGFEGIDNFRDLGGYATEDGRQVRWGVLYRSGALDEASRADLATLQTLNLHTLVDLRSGSEREEAPNRLPEAHGFSTVAIPILDGGGDNIRNEILRRIESGDFEGFDPDAIMTSGNRHFANRYTPQYREFFDSVLAADGSPMLWHCTAGKDRTGFAAAVLLRILGVPEETVVQDYLLSREISLAAHRRDLTLLRWTKGDETADQLAVLFGVEPGWLQAGLDEIDSHWGSFDAYVEQGLGLGPEQVARLRQRLLE